MKMLKKISAVVLVLVIICVASLSASAAQADVAQTSAKSYESMYNDILSKYAYGIKHNWNMGDYSNADLCYLVGLDKYKLSEIGYTLMDLDNNGIKELLIAPVNYKSQIYDMYTISSGNIKRVMQAGERNRFALCNSNYIMNQGSSGADNSICAYYTLKGDHLKVKEALWYYNGKILYAEKEPTYDNAGYFYSISSSSANAISKKYTLKSISYTALSKSTSVSGSVQYFTCATPSVSSVTNGVGGVNVSWGKVSGAAKYRVYYKVSGGSWTKAGDTTSTSYKVTGLKSGTTYSFTVRCINSSATSFTSNYNATGKSINYIAVPKITGVGNACGGINVSWGKVTGAERYRIYYKTTGGSWTKAGDSTSTSYKVTGLKSGATYSFTVRCLNRSATAFTSSYDATGKSIKYLAVPNLVSATVSGTKINVKWGKTAGASGYYVYRKTAGSSWSRIAAVTTLSYADATAKKGVVYIYTVRAYYGNNASSFDATGVSAKR